MKYLIYSSPQPDEASNGTVISQMSPRLRGHVARQRPSRDSIPPLSDAKATNLAQCFLIKRYQLSGPGNLQPEQDFPWPWCPLVAQEDSFPQPGFRLVPCSPVDLKHLKE